ncbi:hypothetical protein PV04_03016 [Phialophora macrospora]|uniref:Uncharacterized protein n=1 Tax=Phialophora macrospora TaxID=1851006 RepID=A0A0D2FWB1_9EURO|nr:hypothetical protein PV04_03016 [Phialophora macrospora]
MRIASEQISCWFLEEQMETKQMLQNENLEEHKAGGAREELPDSASLEGAARLRRKEALEVEETRATPCNADRGCFHLSLPTEDEGIRRLGTQRQALFKHSRLDNGTHQGGEIAQLAACVSRHQLIASDGLVHSVDSVGY